jgi:predicted transcriptional regulator
MPAKKKSSNEVLQAFSVPLTKAQRAALKEIAQELDRKPAQVARIAIREYLERRGKAA